MTDPEQLEQQAFSFYEEEKTAPEPQDVFDSEDDALDALTDQGIVSPSATAEKDDGWVPCDPDDPIDAAAAEWLASRNAVPESGPDSPSKTAAEASPVIETDSEPMTEEPLPVSSSSSCESPETAEKSRKCNPFSLSVLRRVALGFLASKRPAGLGVKIGTSIPRLSLDAAAFTLRTSARTGEASPVASTLLTVVSTSPERCAIPATLRATLEQELAALEVRKNELEAQIRENEPELNASLFAETAVWEYDKSRNRRYHACLRRIERVRKHLEHGGKLERILAERLADYCYLLVPEGAALPETVPPAWGILIAGSDGAVRVKQEASGANADPVQRTLLALRIAAAAAPDVLFANGIAMKDGAPVYHPLPKKRRRSLL